MKRQGAFKTLKLAETKRGESKNRAKGEAEATEIELQREFRLE